MNSETLQKIFDDFNRHDIDVVMESFTDDCVFDTHTNQKIIGKQQVGDAFKNTCQTFKDAHWELHNHHGCGDNIVVTEWTFSGTDLNGHKTEIRGTDIFTLRDDKILIKNAFRKYLV